MGSHLASAPTGLLGPVLAGLIVLTPAAIGQRGTASGALRGVRTLQLGSGPSSTPAPTVASLGDLDGDGTSELVQGWSTGTLDGRATGLLEVHSLQANGTARPRETIGEDRGGFGGRLSPVDRFGHALADLGDVDGDGGTDCGAVWILFLRRDGTVRAERKLGALTRDLAGELAPGDEFGRALAPLGDLDGDGTPDVAIAAPYDDDGHWNAGAVHLLAVGSLREGGREAGALWLLFLRADGTLRTHEELLREAGMGTSLASVGDLDGDGVADLVAGLGGRDDGRVAFLLLRPARGEAPPREEPSLSRPRANPTLPR